MKNILGAVAVMHIKIKNRDAIKLVRLKRVNSADGNVIENAKSHRLIVGGVMAARPHRAKRIANLARHHHIDTLHDRARSALGGDE